MQATTALSATALAPAKGATSKLAFARHYGEMVLVMFVGMAVFGGLASLAFAAGDSSLSAQSGALQVTMMGLYMTVPMVAWMAYRGHTTAQNVEMAASMIIPTAFAAILALTAAAGDHAAMTIQHAIMLPAMLAVMLFRYDEYAHVHHV